MALVGLTGSGKTTLTALTTRLYDVTGGSITLDGVDIRDLTREELRTHIAMAFEDATLFCASVRDNVLLGRPELAATTRGARRGRARAHRGAAHRAGGLRRTTCPTASTRRSARRA